MQVNFKVFCFMIFVILLSLLSACNIDENKEYSQIGNQADFKILSFTSNSNLIKDGDLVEFKSYHLKNNKIKLAPDSSKLNELFNDTITFRNTGDNLLMMVLRKLQEGDSCVVRLFNRATILIDKKENSVQKSDTVYSYIKVKHVYKGKEKMAYLLEENSIARYITYSGKQWQVSESGLFYRIIKPSVSKELVYSDPIKLVYKGYFLNNQVFDNYADINPYFEYRVGTQNQLIKGLEIAVNYMSYGSQAEFIIPSSLAFGKQGSSTGIVAAYKPLLYKIKILNKEEM